MCFTLNISSFNLFSQILLYYYISYFFEIKIYKNNGFGTKYVCICIFISISHPSLSLSLSKLDIDCCNGGQ